MFVVTNACIDHATVYTLGYSVCGTLVVVLLLPVFSNIMQIHVLQLLLKKSLHPPVVKEPVKVVCLYPVLSQ